MRIYHRMCKSLADWGYNVELVAHPMADENLGNQIKLRSLGEYSKPTLSWRLIERLNRSGRAYSLARQSKASIFQFYSPEFIQWGKRLRRVSGRPIIFDCMEDYEGYAQQRRGIPTPLRQPLMQFVRNQTATAAETCDAVIVADEGTARKFEAYARRLLVIHNFPRLELFPDNGNVHEEKPFDIVYHGSIPKYHLDVCLAIDRILMERGYAVRWRFIGQLPERAWFGAELSRRRIEKRFFVSGLMPHDQVAKEVQKAKLGIIPLPDLPKFQNNIPQKLFEFMALGLPVVLSDLPPSRPFVGDGACALMVPPPDYSAYADAIIKLLDDPNLRFKMGAEGRRRVEDEFNWERESKRLLDLYTDFL